MEELIKYYKKVEILCKVDIKKLHNVDFEDLYEYYLHKLYVLWNRYQVKHKDNYTFEKLYNADKQFWLYNYLNSSKKRHEVSYDIIIDSLGEEEKSYILEDFNSIYEKIDAKIFLDELQEKANLTKEELKCINLYLKGYTVKEITNILEKKAWNNAKKRREVILWKKKVI